MLLKKLSRLAEKLRHEPCPRCGRETPIGFCRDCIADFCRIESPCRRCGMPEPCSACPSRQRGWQIDAVRAPFAYAAPLSLFVRDLKFGGQRLLGRALGELLAADVMARGVCIDALVIVPLHPRRLRARRFNQSDEIAAWLSARLCCPLLHSAAARKLDTPPQTELDAKQRQKMAAETFSVNCDLQAKRIALVDDVITTGATANALATSLRAAGAARVEAWAVARSTGRGDQNDAPALKR